MRIECAQQCRSHVCIPLLCAFISFRACLCIQNLVEGVNGCRMLGTLHQAGSEISIMQEFDWVGLSQRVRTAFPLLFRGYGLHIMMHFRRDLCTVTSCIVT